MSVETLIDKAAKTVGNRNRLAKAMNVKAQQISDWEAGRKPCSPGDRARLAGFAREDAMQELARATVETAKGEVRQQQLRQLLGGFMHQTGAVTVFVSASLASLTYGVSHFIQCILC